MKIIKRILIVSLVLLLIGTAGFVYWCLDAYQPGTAAFEAMQTDSQVTVSEQNGIITFEPTGKTPVAGFVFVPGARVDHRAYAPILRRIAAKGFFTAVVNVRLNISLFEPNAPQRVISQYPNIKVWAVGGHSLGGVGAANFAAENLAQVRGIVFWASYPINDSLKNTDLKVISIYGSNDMGGLEPFEKSRELLPAQAKFVEINGANHAQFGDYGQQAGDKPASISAEEQWTQTVNETVKFLEALNYAEN